MLFEVFPLSGLQVEPCVGEGADMGQKCFDERMKLILGETERRIHNCRAAGGACTSVCGLEVCVSVGARGRERRRELGEGGGKKKIKPASCVHISNSAQLQQPALLPLHALNFNPA